MTRGRVFSPNDNHPPIGSSIKVEPIRDLNQIQQIKILLADNKRDLCLFTLGINTAYRASEMLSLSVGQVFYLAAGDRFDLKERKTKKYRPVTLNRAAIEAIGAWLEVHPDSRPEAPLFWSQRDRQGLRVSTVSTMVKTWCAMVGLNGNYASHTLRKTWGYHQRVTYGRPTALLTRAFGHSSEAQTLEYLCIQPEEIEELYALEL